MSNTPELVKMLHPPFNYFHGNWGPCSLSPIPQAAIFAS